nr:hypothetical protein [Tanacetum cinerariifolium]
MSRTFVKSWGSGGVIRLCQRTARAERTTQDSGAHAVRSGDVLNSPHGDTWDVSGTKIRSGFTGVKSVAGLSPQPSRAESTTESSTQPSQRRAESTAEGEKDRRAEDGDGGVS